VAITYLTDCKGKTRLLGWEGVGIMAELTWFSVKLCENRNHPAQYCNIFLPHRSPLGTYDNLQNPPTDKWTAMFLCPLHGQVFVRSSLDVHPDIGTAGRDQLIPPFWEIECGCGHESCGRLHTIYAAGTTDSSAIVNRILETNPIVECASHLLVWKRELIQLRRHL
jgi:hypothetical protein